MHKCDTKCLRRAFIRPKVACRNSERHNNRFFQTLLNKIIQICNIGRVYDQYTFMAVADTPLCDPAGSGSHLLNTIYIERDPVSSVLQHLDCCQHAGITGSQITHCRQFAFDCSRSCTTVSIDHIFEVGAGSSDVAISRPRGNEIDVVFALILQHHGECLGDWVRPSREPRCGHRMAQLYPQRVFQLVSTVAWGRLWINLDVNTRLFNIIVGRNRSRQKPVVNVVFFSISTYSSVSSSDIDDGHPVTIDLHLEVGLELRSAVRVHSTIDLVLHKHVNQRVAFAVGDIRRDWDLSTICWSDHQFACGADVCVFELTIDFGAASDSSLVSAHQDHVVELIVGLVLIPASSAAWGVFPDDLASVLIISQGCGWVKRRDEAVVGGGVSTFLVISCNVFSHIKLGFDFATLIEGFPSNNT